MSQVGIAMDVMATAMKLYEQQDAYIAVAERRIKALETQLDDANDEREGLRRRIKELETELARRTHDD